ncbi:unnamed protein product [Cladocopium goreaui]|uniref:MATH domain-containing protein n=1 Tax=Cladocopium goreaui TaxID=2562237 RepID=A0A9P1GT25_9DINO|nr:unnamed protein product [Cladocopium goreaui]
MASTLAKRGLVRWRNVLRPELCAALRAEAVAMLEEVSRPSLSAFWHQLQRWLLDPVREPKARHILRAPLTSAVQEALGPLAQRANELELNGARLVELNYTISQPGAPAQAPHSDISPLQSVPRIVTFWAALQDTDLAMGPTVIWPSSHRLARDFIRKLPEELQKPRVVPEYMYVEGQLQAVSRKGQPILEEQLEEERQQSAEAAAALLNAITASGPKEFMAMATGDVVAMDCRVFHQGGANISSKTRVLFNASFQVDDVERSESTDSLHELSPKINGFTYHCLPEVAQAAYRTHDLGERELKAEIRAAQRLLLEVAESARHISPERLTASQMAVKAAAPKADAPVGPGPPLPALPGFGTGGSSSVLEDVGTLTAHDDIVEWNVPGVRARARLGTAHPLISEAFEVHRFPDVKALRLKIFPLGSRRRTKPGHCSVYLTGPQGTHLQFMLRMGSVEHGPLECIFDRPEKDSGRHDFCALEDELEVDGSAAVRLTVLRADFVPT